MTSNPHWGSSLNDFLADEGVRTCFEAIVEEEILAFQLAESAKGQQSDDRDPHP